VMRKYFFAEKLQWMYNTRPNKRRLDLIQNNYLLYATPEGKYKVWALNKYEEKDRHEEFTGIISYPGRWVRGIVLCPGAV